MAVIFIEAILLGFVLSIPIGPVTIEMFRRAVRYNVFESIKIALGAFCSEIISFSIVWFGLSQFVTSDIIKINLGLFGIVVLFYLALINAADYFQLINNNKEKHFYKNSFITGFAITFFNPANIFIWVGLIGAFFIQTSSFFIASGILIGVFMVLFILVLISALGQKIISKKYMRFVSLIAGLCLLYFAIKLLIDILLLT